VSKKIIITILIVVVAFSASLAMYPNGYKRFYKTMGVFNNSPDFNAIADINQLKQQFIRYLLPLIKYHNNNILILRNSIINNKLDKDKLEKLAKHYKTTPYELLTKVDIIPTSLALAQAAMESNWGRSRFAKYNNYFGIWCFNPGCGILPAKKDKNAKHEVAIFLTTQDAISYYMWNLNTNNAYQQLRLIRKELRDDKQKLSGEKLANGLEKYSGVGHNYIKTLKKIIKYNNLQQYD
jgi:Bax protein